MCNEKCAKVSFMTFNVIFMLAGLGILAAGVYIRVMKTQYDAFFGSSALMIVTYIMMAAGGLVVLISLAGCVGAYTRSRLILGIYFVFLVIIFAIEAAAGIIGFVNYDKVLPVLKEYAEAGIMNKYGYEDYRAISMAIDVMQQELKCCGFNAPMDWQTSKYYTDANTASARGSTVVPRSCCKTINEENCNNAFDPNKIYNVGCADSLLSWAKENLLVVGGVCIGVAMIQATRRWHMRNYMHKYQFQVTWHKWLHVFCGTWCTLFGMVLSLCLCKSSGEAEESF